MHAILVAVPPSVAEEVEHQLRQSGSGRDCQVLRVAEVGTLPVPVVEGLLVAWDEGGPLEEAVERCRRLHAFRVAARTQLVVLTGRLRGLVAAA